MNVDELSTILYLSRGVTDTTSIVRKDLNSDSTANSCVTNESLKLYKNAIPSAGALYPIEVYVAIFNIKGVERGLYHYYPLGHLLETIKLGDFREPLQRCFIDNEILQVSNMIFLITAVFQRNQMKYGERGYRYILFEAGHVAQNVYLSSNGMDIGATAIGGFDDDGLNSFMGLDGDNESTVYALALGKK